MSSPLYPVSEEAPDFRLPLQHPRQQALTPLFLD